MARYEYQCKKCETEYEVESLMSKKEETVKKAKCPKCKSKAKQELFTAANFNFTNPEGTDRWNSDSKGHDYRCKSKQPKVRAERAAAAAASKVGPNPYNTIDDISSGKYFGPVQ